MSDNNKNMTATDAAETPTAGANNEGSVTTLNINKSAKEAARETAKDTYSHRFNTPFEHDGQKYITLDFHFGKLTGHDMVKIEQEMQDENVYVIASEVSKNFQCKLAARAGNIGSDVIMDMPIRDFNKITNEARAFLLNSGY